MIEISRILCPVDYSEPSALALRTSLTLARWYGADVLVPHVVALALPPVPFAAATPVVLTPEQRAQVDAQLRQFIDAAEPDGVEVTTAVLEGPAVSEVLRQAEDWPADLVVMGTHGRSGFDHLLMGSVTERLLRKADVPVLTVRAGVDPPGTSPPAPFRRILCPVDYSPASLNALRYALSLAQESGGRLTLLHVMEWPVDLSALEVLGAEAARAQQNQRDAAHRRLAAAVPDKARSWCEVDELVATGRAYEEILDTARHVDADLIVLGAHGRAKVTRHALGATTDHVVRAATCPVLTVRGEALHETAASPGSQPA